MTRLCPGPLPVTAPKFKAPRNACDTHVHVIGPYAKYPMVTERTFTSPEAPVETVKAFLDTMGIERVVIVHITVSGTNPSVTLDAIQSLGQHRARGIVILDENTSREELLRLHEGGIRGARLTPLFGEEVDARQLKSIAERIAFLGWHLLFMPSGPSQWLQLAPLLAELPVEVVVDHMAWRGWSVESGLDQPGFRALRDLLATGRAWVKLGGVYRYSRENEPWTDVVPFARAMVEDRPDRLLWCTDWPHVRCWDHQMPSDASLLDWLVEAVGDAATVNRILVDNPAALYGFDTSIDS